MTLRFLFLIFGGLFLFAQNGNFEFYNYQSNQNTYNLELKTSAIKSIDSVLDSLQKIGYYTLSVDSVKANKKITKVYLNKGKLYKKIWIKNDSIFERIPKKYTEKAFFPVQNLDSLKQSIYAKYANQGFPFVKLELNPVESPNSDLYLKLSLDLLGKRSIDHVQIQGYEKLSKAYLKHGLNIKIGETYNEQKLHEISERINQSTYIQEIRSPQTLFAKDSTVVYLYIKKQKSNYFDGILGFGNDNNGEFRLNGNVDLNLNNNFNGLETIGLHWKSTPDRNTTLNLNIKVPYLFNSAVGSETQFELFRQDSVFVNTKASEKIFYQLNPNSQIGVNFSFEGSNFVLNDNPLFNQTYSDYSKTGIGLNYEFLQASNFRILEGKNYLALGVSALSRSSDELEDDNQYKIDFKAFRLFRLAKSHYVKTLLEGSGLFSENDEFLENELNRFGGFGSIRGFNEQSLVADSFGIASLEYRFVPNDNFYVSLFGDYGFLENQINDITENLVGIGTGFSFLTKIGVFNISYAVGKFSDTAFDFNNSKVHFGIVSQF